MAGCSGPCKCPTFQEHAQGIHISSAAMPSRSNVGKYEKTEKTWDEDFNAYRRLDTQHGVQLQSMDGAAEFEKKVSQPVELQTGKIYGEDRAKKMQAIVDGDA